MEQLRKFNSRRKLKVCSYTHTRLLSDCTTFKSSLCVGRRDKPTRSHMLMLLLLCFRGLFWLRCPVTSLTPSTETPLRNSTTSPMTPPPQVHRRMHTDRLTLDKTLISNSLPSSSFLSLVCCLAVFWFLKFLFLCKALLLLL